MPVSHCRGAELVEDEEPQEVPEETLSLLDEGELAFLQLEG